MTELKIINENPISMMDTHAKLKEIKKNSEELSFRAQKCEEYLKLFAKNKKATELYKKVEGLEIPRIKDRHIIKIIDLMPEDLDSLKIVMSGELLTITDEDMKKILEVING